MGDGMKNLSPLIGIAVAVVVLSWVVDWRGEDKIDPQHFVWAGIAIGVGYFAYRAWKNRRGG